MNNHFYRNGENHYVHQQKISVKHAQKCKKKCKKIREKKEFDPLANKIWTTLTRDTSNVILYTN